MSKLDAFIQEKQQRSEEWKAQKTAERDELNAWSDNAILTATMEPSAYLHYLDVQADNPRYSASNILLAMEQNPEITYINSLQCWNALGRSVKREETGLKAEAFPLLTSVLTTPGFCTEHIGLYLATGLSQHEDHPDPDEFLHVEKLPLKEAVDRVMTGEFRDAKTIIGILMAWYRLHGYEKPAK